MLTSLRGIRAGALACAAVALALAPAAQAAEVPAPCDGKLLVTDKAGDQSIKVQGNPAQPAPANTDAVGLFFRTDDGKVTANIVVADLTKAIPQGFQAVRYRAYVTFGGNVRYVQALLTSGGVAYTYGSYFQGLVYEKEGDTTGTFTEGKNGVVQIVLPAAIGGKPGSKLDAVSASNGLLTVGNAPEESQTNPIYFGVDTAPDGTSTVTTTAPDECPKVAAPEAPPAEGPAPEAPAAPAPQQQQQPAPAPAPAPAQPAVPAPFQAQEDLRVKLAKGTISSRKARRMARLSLRTNERITFLSVKLKRGSRVLSRMELDAAGDRATLRLKLRKRLARGAHTIEIRGTRPNGLAFTQRLDLRVTR